MRSLLVILLAVILVSPAFAAELADVTLPDAVQVDDSRLVLNGMGLREKFFIDVYVAGLYLPEKMSSGEAILSSDTSRQTVMHFVYDVDKDKICDAWSDSLEANTDDVSMELAKKFETLCSWMENMAEGERMVFTYVPGTGTTIEVRGKEKGTLEGKDFADALFASWIGDEPATGKLKKGMLGG